MSTTEPVVTALAHFSRGDLDARRLDGLADDLAAAWLSSLHSPATRAAYERDWLRFAAWLSEVRGPAVLAVSFPLVEAYARHMREVEQPAKRPTTQARRLAAVSSFYRYAVKAGVLDRNPAAAELVDRPPTGPDHVRLTPALTPADVAELLAASSNPQDRALVLLLGSTGMRVTEALSIDLDAITTERGHAVVVTTGKGGKAGTTPLVPALQAEVDAVRAIRTSGPLFVAEHGGRMTRQGAQRALARLAHRAGLGKPVTPHMLRATAITSALQAGVALDRVQRMARHSDPRTTVRYHRAADDLDEHPAYRLAGVFAEAAKEACVHA